MNESRELFKFVNDPIYRQKAIEKYHKACDKNYQNGIQKVQSEINKLEKQRQKTIQSNEDRRWEKFCDSFWVNEREGKIKVNGTDFLFSSIHGAEINISEGVKIITEENGKSKKHASIGGAALGAVVAGPLGAAVGGSALGKTTHKGKAISNQIPTCNHLGININLNGFVNEVVLLDKTIEQSSSEFKKSKEIAEKIISKLRILANQPVPETYVLPEEEDNVKEIEKQIKNKKVELVEVTNNKPTYELPSYYRTEEQSSMTDQEYLDYLIATDSERQANQEVIKNDYKKKLAEEKATKKANQTTLSKILTIISWIFSVLLIFAGLILIFSKSILSGIFILLVGAFINPKLQEFISDNYTDIPKAIKIGVVIGGLILAIMFSSSSETAENSSNSTDASSPKSSEATISESTVTPEPTVESTNNLSFVIDGETIGDYGEEYTLNEGTDFPETVIMYKVPSGTYKATNEGNNPSQINVYSNTTRINEDGWEEFGETISNTVVAQKDSVQITIPDGYHIDITPGSNFSIEKLD